MYHLYLHYVPHLYLLQTSLCFYSVSRQSGSASGISLVTPVYWHTVRCMRTRVTYSVPLDGTVYDNVIQGKYTFILTCYHITHRFSACFIKERLEAA